MTGASDPGSADTGAIGSAGGPLTDGSRDDPRWARVAELLVRWSTGVRPGERVLIVAGEARSLDLARLVHAEVVRAGGHPQVVFGSDHLDADLLRLGSIEQATWLPEVEQQAMQWADVSIVLRAGDLVHEDGALPVERVAARRGALGRVSATRTAGTRWVIVRLPSPGIARQAGLALDDLTEAYFRAVLRDWAQARDAMQRVVDRLTGAREIHVQGRGTDLRLSMAGRTWLLDDGHINMPGGELATSPVEDSAEGEVLFEGPAVFAGHVFEGIRLRFEAGIAVEARAERNDALFQALLGIDEGARRVGEVGFGTNPGLRTLCGDLFYDEKVPGTVHLALGRSYASCGGRNQSALHWDIVKDLRGEGSVTIDGQVVVGPGGLLEELLPSV